MPEARLQTWVAVVPRLHRPRQGQSCGRNFRLAEVRVFTDLRQLRPVQVATLEIHSRVSPGGVLAQYPVEKDERLKHVLPPGLPNLPQTFNAYPDSVRALGVGHNSRSA